MTLRSLLKLPYHIRDLIHYLRAFTRQEHTNMEVIRVSNAKYRLAARKLHADVYLKRNFVTEDEVVKGLLHEKIDPYHPHSQYFVVVDKHSKKLIATARQIEAKQYKGHYSFAMFKHTKLYKRPYKLIRSHAAVDCVEISGLAKQRGVSKLAPLLLYKAMWRHSLENKHELWLLAVDVILYVRLKLLFGSAIQQAGPKVFYLGSWSVPAVMKIQSSIQALERSLEKALFYQRPLRYRVAQFMLKDAPVEMLNKKERLAYERIMSKYK